MAVNKFTFISPGIFLNEVDESQNPIAPEVMGPIIIGRTQKGPAMRPVKVNSYEDFVSVFGDPVPGATNGDVWRSGVNTGPTYAGYAAKAWLMAGTAPATIVRLLGEDHTDASSTTSGWTTTNDPSASLAKNGGAYGLFVIDSGSATSFYTGTLAAIWYLDSGSMMVLSGTHRSGAIDNSTATLLRTGADSMVSASAGSLVLSHGSNNKFHAQLYHTDGAGSHTLAKDFGKFNFDKDDSNLYIRNVFNTTPSLVNSDITDTDSLSMGENRYWLGESFERSVLDKTTSTSNQWGVILPLMSGGLGVGWHDRKNSWTNAQTGWFFSQDFGVYSAYKAPNTCTKLFKFHALDYGSWPNANLKIAIEDIRAATTPTSPYGSFTVAVYPANASDATAKNEALERFTRCNLDPNSADFVEQKIGNKYLTWSDNNKIHTEIGEYNNKSKYIRIEMNPIVKDNGHNKSSLPFGFTGPIRSKGFSYLNKLDPRESAVATMTITDAGQCLAGSTISLITTGADTVLITGHASDNAMTTTSGASTDGTFDASTASNSSADNIAQALAIATCINLHDDFTATAAGAVVTIKQNTVGTGGNTTITIDDGTSAGTIADSMTLVSFAGGVDTSPTGCSVLHPKYPYGSDTNKEALRTAVIHTLAYVSGAYDSALTLRGAGFLGTSNVIYAGNHQFSGSWEFPAVGLRSSSADGGTDLGTDAYFGVQTTRQASSNKHDDGYGEYNIGLPFGTAVNSGGGRFDTLTGPPSNAEYQWVFSLDDIVGATAPYIHSSGSRRGNRSLTAVNDDYTAVLTEGLTRYWAPMYGGHDGIDIKESEPFRNSRWSASTTNLSDAAFNSVQRAVHTIEDPESVECNIITAPGITNTALTDLVMNTCQNRADALAIIDIPDVFKPDTENTQSYSNRLGSVTTAVSGMQTRDINNSYACTYYPWVQIKDTKENRLLHVPPSVIALGTFASSEAVSELWFAPAGFTRGGLTNGAAGLPVTGVTERLTSKKRDDLYENNINPIAKFPAEGIVIFGQKTLQQTSSALDRINVRRLMIYVKKEISRIAATILFDQNVSVTWSRFTGEVEPFLSDVRARLGLTDFKVVLDETTTTPDLVDRNIMYAKIYLKPARAIEYIAVDFIITRTGAAFED